MLIWQSVDERVTDVAIPEEEAIRYIEKPLLQFGKMQKPQEIVDFLTNTSTICSAWRSRVRFRSQDSG